MKPVWAIVVVMAVLSVIACPPRLPVCEIGAQRCNDDFPEVCHRDGWVRVGSLRCGDVGGVCSTGFTAHCIPGCVNGTERCVNNQIQLCESRVWQMSVQCTTDAGQVCELHDGGMAVCTNMENKRNE